MHNYAQMKKGPVFLTCSQLPNFLFHALSEKRKGSSVWWLMKAHQTLLITPRSINIYELSIRRCTTCLPERLVSEAMQYRRTRWKLKKHRNTECREHTFVDPPVICCTENKAAKRLSTSASQKERVYLSKVENILKNILETIQKEQTSAKAKISRAVFHGEELTYGTPLSAASACRKHKLHGE